MDISKQSLFMVDFGEPTPNGYFTISFGKSQIPSVYVLASDYNEAVKKSLEYVKLSLVGKSIIDEIGSLDITEEEFITVKNVSLISIKVIY